MFNIALIEVLYQLLLQSYKLLLAVLVQGPEPQWYVSFELDLMVVFAVRGQLISLLFQEGLYKVMLFRGDRPIEYFLLGFLYFVIYFRQLYAFCFEPLLTLFSNKSVNFIQAGREESVRFFLEVRMKGGSLNKYNIEGYQLLTSLCSLLLLLARTRPRVLYLL